MRVGAYTAAVGGVARHTAAFSRRPSASEEEGVDRVGREAVESVRRISEMLVAAFGSSGHAAKERARGEGADTDEVADTGDVADTGRRSGHGAKERTRGEDGLVHVSFPSA